MKSLSTLLVLALLSTASCKKTEDSVYTPPERGKWTLGNTTYSVNSNSSSGELFYSYDTSGNQISFAFKSFPPPAGNYTVINDTAQITAQTVKVFVSGPVSGNTYFSTGTENKAAEISFEMDKIKIVLPEVWVKKAYSDDSLKVSANLIPL